jgi:hypothetical protein
MLLPGSVEEDKVVVYELSIRGTSSPLEVDVSETE